MSSDTPADNNTNNGPKLADSAAAVAQAENATDDTAVTTATTKIGSTTVTGLPLDWTQLGNNNNNNNTDKDNNPPEPNIRYPLDVVESLDVTDGELVLVGTHGQKITHLGPDFGRALNRALQEQHVPHLVKLIIRSHVIQHVQGLQDLLPPNTLQVLEFYDNQVQSLTTALTPNITSSLIVLDMSYNAIRDMQPVEHCVHLRELCK